MQGATRCVVHGASTALGQHHFKHALTRLLSETLAQQRTAGGDGVNLANGQLCLQRMPQRVQLKWLVQVLAGIA